MEAGASPWTSDHGGRTCLHYAAAKNDSGEIIKAVVESSASIAAASHASAPLRPAARVDNFHRHSAGAALKDAASAATAALKGGFGRLSDAIHLAGHGGNKSRSGEGPLVNVATPKGFTPLMYAAWYDNHEAAAALMRAGAALKLRSWTKNADSDDAHCK